MTDKHKLGAFFKNQAELARILGGGTITSNIRVKAHRIWHGMKPNSDDIALLCQVTKGQLDANYFHGLKQPKNLRGK